VYTESAGMPPELMAFSSSLRVFAVSHASYMGLIG